MFQAARYGEMERCAGRVGGWQANKGSENSDPEPENRVSQPVLAGPSGGWVLGVVRGWKILEGRLASNNHNPDSDKFIYLI
jgi:hypothetical protein